MGASFPVVEVDPVAVAELAAEISRAESAEGSRLARSANLSDLASPSVARSNLGLGTAATESAAAFDAAGAATAEVQIEKTRAEGAESLKLAKASNLSDLSSAATARTNLGLGSAATQATSAFDAAGVAASAVAAEKSRAEAAEALGLAKASNLSDLASAATARSNLGLGTAAMQSSSAFDVAGAAAGEETRAKAAEATLTTNIAAKAGKAEVEILNKGTDWSAGDNVTVYTANPESRKARIVDGTAASPVTEAHPTMKVSRTSGVTGGVTGDGATELGAIYGSSSGTVASKVQEIGVIGTAKNVGTEGEPDACGIYGVGRVLAAGKGRAFGGFLLGRRDGAEARATGLECAVENLGGADSYDINTGAETTKGIWLHGGTAKSAVGIQVGTISEAVPSFDVAFGINKFAVATAAYQDNSAAERSIQIKGTHAKASISVALGAGPVVLGNEEVNFAGSQLFELYYGEEALDPGFVFGTGKGKSVSGILMRNSTGQMKVFAANAANAFLTGTAQGDTGINFTAGKVFHVGAQTKTSLLRVTEAGVGIGVKEPSLGGGKGVLFVGNAETAPSTNPTAGGILYCEAGKLMYRGSSGTVTTIAVA
jgi:hypothetical protein